MKKRKRFWPQAEENESSFFMMRNGLMQLWLLLPLIWSLLAVQSGHSLLLAGSSQCLSQNLACNCSWKSGKFVADCNSNLLKKVPNNDYYDHLMLNSGNNQMPTLARDIQSLNLSNNLISELGDAELSEKKFRNLQRLYLSANQLFQIHPNAFFKLTGLIELDLSYNQLISLVQEASNGNESSECFMRQLANLRQLNLASNKLARLEARTFADLRQLRQLILSNNQIAFIHPNAFQELNQLNVLHLDDNKLTSLDGNLMMQVPQLYSVKLGGGSNKWHCDCKLRPLIRQLVNFRTKSSQATEASSQVDYLGQTSTFAAANTSLAGSLTILEDEPQCYRQPMKSLRQNHSNATLKTSPFATNNHQTIEPQQTAWTNMTLAQFQCKPKLLLQFHQQPNQDSKDNRPPAAYNSAQSETTFMNINQRAIGSGTQSPRALPDETRANGPFHLGDTDLVRPIAVRRQSLEKPIELTCIFELWDELDLEQTQIEWFAELQSNHFKWSATTSNGRDKSARRLLLDYSPANKATQLFPPTSNPLQQATLIDYITSPRASLDNDGAATKSINDDAGEKDQVGTSSFLRIVHFLLEPASLLASDNYNRSPRDIETNLRAESLLGAANEKRMKRETSRLTSVGDEDKVELSFLCRVTNLAGQSELHETIKLESDASNDYATASGQIDPASVIDRRLEDQNWLLQSSGGQLDLASDNSSEQLSLELQPPRVVRKYLDQVNGAKSNINNHFPNLTRQSPLELAKLALFRELMLESANRSTIKEPLFIPIEMPTWLLTESNTNDAQSGFDAGAVLQQTSDQVATSDQQQPRPTIRQTNGTLATGSLQKQQQQQRPLDSRQLRRQRRLQPIAWALIDEHTRLDQEQSEHLELGPGNVAGSRSSAANFGQNLGMLLRYQKDPKMMLNNQQKQKQQQSVNWPLKEWTMNSMWLSLKSFYKRHLDRYVQFAIGHVFVLLLICSSILLVSTLLSVALILMSRKRRRRLQDQSPTKHNGHKRQHSPDSLQTKTLSKSDRNNQVRYSPDVISCISVASERARSSSVSSISDLMLQAASSLRPPIGLNNQQKKKTLSSIVEQEKQLYLAGTTATNTCESSSSTNNDSDRKLIRPPKSNQLASSFHNDFGYDSDFRQTLNGQAQDYKWAQTLQRPPAIRRKNYIQKSSTLSRSNYTDRTISDYPNQINMLDSNQQEQDYHQYQINAQIGNSPSPSPFYQVLSNSDSLHNDTLQMKWHNDNNYRLDNDTNSSILGAGSHLVLVEPPESKYFATLMEQQNRFEQSHKSLQRHHKIQPSLDDDEQTTSMMMQPNQSNRMSYIQPRSNFNENLPHSVSLTSPAASSNTSAGPSDQQLQQQQQPPPPHNYVITSNNKHYGTYCRFDNNSNNDNRNMNNIVDSNNLTPQNSRYIDGALQFLNNAIDECLPREH